MVFRVSDSRGQSRPFLDGLAWALIALGTLVIVFITSLQSMRSQAFDRERTVDAIGRDLRLDLTRAHLALEALVAGEADLVPSRDVSARYDHAERLLERLRDDIVIGGRLANRDPLLSDRLTVLGRHVGELRRIADDRLAGGQRSRAVNDPLAARYDAIFLAASDQAGAISETLDALMARDRLLLDRLEMALDALLVILFGFAAVAVARHRRTQEAKVAVLEQTVEASTRDVLAREAHASALLNSTIDAIVTADENGCVEGCNPAAERLFGWSEKELVGMHVRELMGEPYRSMSTSALGAYFVRARDNARGVSEIVNGRQRDGRDLILDMSLNVMRSSDHTGFLAIMRDVGERVAAEQRFQVIFDHATSAHFLMHADGIIDCNGAAVTLFAAPDKARLLALELGALLPEHQPNGQPSVEVVSSLLQRGRTLGALESELQLRRLSGEFFPADVTVTPVQVDGQSITLLEVRDLSERRQSEHALVVAKDVAEAAARAKSQFLATVSHEIRTPMNGILGMTGLLLESGLDDTQLQYTQAVKSSADSLLAIINDILDFSKIEAGKLTIEPLPFDLVGTLEDACDLLAPRANEKRIALALHVARGVPAQFVGDAGRVRQIALNLLTNAVKFTTFGHVVLELDVLDQRGTDATVRLSVHDTGMGIPESQQSRIFEDFSQGDASMSRRFGGTGLGLAITRRIAESMGGAAGFRSVEGRGSTFWVTMRLTVPADAGEVSPMPDLADRRVLVVDAHDVTRRALAQRLESFGTQVDTRALGDQALQHMRQAVAQGTPYDVVFVEVGTRTSDDLTFAQAVWKERKLEHTPMVLLARPADAISAQTAFDMGYVDIVTKPARGSALLGAMRRARVAREQRATGATTDRGAPRVSAKRKTVSRPSLEILAESTNEPAAASTPTGPRVLLGEDNPVNQMVARALLERAGCAVQVAANGEQAIAASADAVFDVIFMDCQMPVLDGYAATAAIRRREGDARRTPIIAMTANAMPGDRERCLSAGMDDYLAKPIDDARIRGALERWIPPAAPR